MPGIHLNDCREDGFLISGHEENGHFNLEEA